MKNVMKLICTMLLTMTILSCSDVGTASETTSTSDTHGSTEKTDEAVSSLVGKWQLARQGDVDFLSSGIFVEFGGDHTATCEYGVGSEHYWKKSSTVDFEDDWTFEDGRISGHLSFPFCGEHRFICDIKPDTLILLPDEGAMYTMDPTKYLIRVSYNENI
jgi:hypothetical protein